MKSKLRGDLYPFIILLYTYPLRPSSVYRGSRLFLDNSRQSAHDHPIVKHIEEIVTRYVIHI